MITTRRIVLLSFAFCWAIAASPAARAQDSEKAFYAGKTVRMIVGSGVGGGYDVFSRLIAPYLGKTLGATVIVENVPGAGGLLALNKLYAAPPDGLQISLSQGTMAAHRAADRRSGRALRSRQVQLSRDGRRAARTVAGRAGLSRSARCSRRSTPRRNGGGRRRAERRGLGIGAAFTCEALKLDCHIVQGYKSSADAGLAVTRGEMDALYVPESSANHFVKSKQNWALATISRTKSQFFQDRPTVFEAAKIDPDRLWAMDFLANLEGTGRLLMAPPGIPPARLAYLQAAVKETLQTRSSSPRARRWSGSSSISIRRARIRT